MRGLGPRASRAWALAGHRFQRRLLEWYLSLVMLTMGALLLAGGDTFALSPYGYIRQIASEPIWGQLLLGLGGLRMVCLGFNGILPHGTPHVRVILSLVAIVVWSEMAVGYLLSGTFTLMPAFTGWATFFEGVNAYRAARDASVEDTGGPWGGVA